MKIMNINLQERMNHYHVTGLSMALINQGQMKMAEGFGILEEGTLRGVSEQTIFNACSMSKFLTSMLVMTLVDQGILDLDEDVNKKLVSWKIHESDFTISSKVTLRSLLSHQSGIIDPEGSFGELDSSYRLFTIADLLEGKTPYCKEAIKISYEPESDFRYSDAGYCVIQQVVEDSIGKPFKSIMQEYIFKPLNMDNSFLVRSLSDIKDKDFSCGHNKNGSIAEAKYPIYPYLAAAGLWTTPTDFAKLVLELISSLNGNSTIGLSKNRAKDLITSQGCKQWAGLGVFLEGSGQSLEISSLGWGKGFQCMMVAYPYLGSGAVMMTNTDLGTHQMNGLIGEIYKSLEL
ncbi:beta-lactamase family protein [Bacillus sp. Bva_UNVM-123]|uniref:serine hydrolase domain-containing protein n=1 Tax=Bacillus sp. Bva_UNVM-123 TaxID=2829798 RepID=UPI00391EF8DB